MRLTSRGKFEGKTDILPFVSNFEKPTFFIAPALTVVGDILRRRQMPRLKTSCDWLTPTGMTRWYRRYLIETTRLRKDFPSPFVRPRSCPRTPNCSFRNLSDFPYGEAIPRAGLSVFTLVNELDRFGFVYFHAARQATHYNFSVTNVCEEAIGARKSKRGICCAAAPSVARYLFSVFFGRKYFFQISNISLNVQLGR